MLSCVVRRARAAAFMVLAMCALACSAKGGWGLVLWPPEGSKLSYGDVVPIYFVSNISQSYAVGAPHSSDKEEVAFWRIAQYKNKSQAEAAARAADGAADLMAVTTRDGLVLRLKPENTSDQVFRFKLGQTMRLLEQADGAAVETGGQVLDGRWYKALADDGTRGYIFSNQLALWHALTEPAPVLSDALAVNQASLNVLFDTVWRPDYFSVMTASGYIDLARYQARFGLFADAQQKMIRVERPDFSYVYKYESITQNPDSSFTIEPNKAALYFTKSGSLILVPAESDISDAAREVLSKTQTGSAIRFEFVPYDKDVSRIIADETRKQMKTLADFAAYGERYENSDGSVLIITKTARFTWLNYDALSPHIIPLGSGETGSIAMNVYVPPELEALWDGAFTLAFDGGIKPSLVFAYRRESAQLQLTYIPPAHVQSAVILETANALTPSIILDTDR